MAYFSAIPIFLGAFLLFLVQPILGKMILPWFGGTPAVWTTCMLFFQVLLLGGYAYAAALTRWLKPREQAWLHCALLVIALLMLPITPGESWKPTDGAQPTARILSMLLVCVGLQYFLLSATSPLVQTWFAHDNPGKSPYRLYALSNVGSLGALLLYPVAIEPTIGTLQQGWVWSIGFVLFTLTAMGLAWHMQRASLRSEDTLPAVSSTACPTDDKDDAVPSWLDRSTWLLLPALATLMLLAVTNHLCQDVAVVPFLWIAPLALYLLSLIVCFDRDQWYKPVMFSLLAMLVILVACDMAFTAYIYQDADFQPRWVLLMKFDIRLLLTVYLSMFFFACMLCHGEVVRRRPQAGRLTEFYLTISAGGALGGIFVAIVCPLIFKTFAELKIGIVLTFVLAVGVLLRQLGVFSRPASESKAKEKSAKKSQGKSKPSAVAVQRESKPPFRVSSSLRYPLGILGGLLIIVVIAAQSVVYQASHTDGPRVHLRNFYGALTVRNWYPEDHPFYGRALYHGNILHGYQFLTPGKELLPTTYYTESSGVGLALRALRGDQPIRVGAVGLGIGTVAAYGQPGDVYRFYEINPLIISQAETNFGFLTMSQAETQVVSGDARLSLEREEPQNFDALVLDAFSGDSIPVHLLTREAIMEYLRHLKPDGVLLVHVSNRYVNLVPIVNRLAIEFDLQVGQVHNFETEGLHLTASEWMLLSKSRKIFEHPSLDGKQTDPQVDKHASLWTDDYNNLVRIIRTP